MGDGSEIFVLEMGNPVNIKDIAYELIRLSGLEPETDINIEYIGLRRGEKMHEELINTKENIVDTRHENILLLKNGHADNWNILYPKIEKVIASSKSYNAKITVSELKNFLSDFSPEPLDWAIGKNKNIIEQKN